MTLNTIIDDFANAMAATKLKLNEIHGALDLLNSERMRIENIPPHTDDIVTSFMRGLDDAAGSFEQRLGSYFSRVKMLEIGSAKAIYAASGQLLMLGAAPDARRLYPHSALGGNQIPIDVAAVTYFLRDKIAADLPAIIDKVCPSAKTGMKQADRKLALQEVDGKIATLSAEQEILVEQIATARKAVYPAAS